jgi:hypothetical protein
MAAKAAAARATIVNGIRNKNGIGHPFVMSVQGLDASVLVTRLAVGPFGPSIDLAAGDGTEGQEGEDEKDEADEAAN